MVVVIMVVVAMVVVVSAMTMTMKYMTFYNVNPLWHSDAIRRNKSGSALAQVIACCMAAPSHYFNQCSFLIGKVQKHSPESLKIILLKLLPHILGTNK